MVNDPQMFLAKLLSLRCSALALLVFVLCLLVLLSPLAVAGSSGCDETSARRAFAKCAACHKVDSQVNAAGPSLKDIIGRKSAALDDFRYSRALRNLGVTWTLENLDAFIASPRKFAPGTVMAFSGISKASDRALVLCFLQSSAVKGARTSAVQ